MTRRQDRRAFYLPYAVDLIDDKLGAVKTEDLKDVRAPAHIACKSDDVACMGGSGPPRVFLEKKMM